MAQALELATQALFRTSPNPRVGCVIVDSLGQVLGHGATQRAGGPHAEIMALRDAQEQGHSVRGATAYVTLEPCAHHGRTGPCCDALVEAGDRFNVGLCGGGTHPFQHWGEQQISDAPRYQYLSDLYGYLAKQFTVFGQHVHIGCSGPDEALCLLHCLSRYMPHCIALAAASPYVQSFDTGFDSARLNSVSAFPMSGRAPFVETWEDFGAYFDKMTDTGVVQSMKDFYWDIRPKPEFGTIEVRVMDTPLTVGQAARIAAFIQAVARWFMIERPFRPAEDDYLVYTFNRFQACRFGYAGTYVDPRTHEQRTLKEEILATLARVEQHAVELHGDTACAELRRAVERGENDAAWLRGVQRAERSLPEVVRQQTLRWRGD